MDIKASNFMKISTNLHRNQQHYDNFKPGVLSDFEKIVDPDFCGEENFITKNIY